MVKLLVDAKADIHAQDEVSACALAEGCVSQCEWLWMRTFGTGERQVTAECPWWLDEGGRCGVNTRGLEGVRACS